MRALALTGTGGLEHLALLDVPPPAVTAPDDVLVRIRAAALNRLDLFIADGLKGLTYRFPHVVGSDGAGVVEAVGPAVNHVAPGDRVLLNPGISCGACSACRAGDEPLCPDYRILGEHRDGTAAELVVVPAVNVAPVPDAMSWAEAAAFPLATLTAWRMLVTRAKVAAGERVLVWGAGGGVAQAAIQIARLRGAEVVATSSSDRKLETARRLGADHVVNHATADVVTEVRRLLGRRSVEVVVDSVGEATWPASLRLLGPAGRLVTCGATSGPFVSLDIRKLFWHQWSLLGSTMGSRREFAEIVQLAARGELRPVVDSVVPLADGVAAYRRLASGAQTGKLVLEVSS
jgi:NADPH:quinone reductase-like Zn-dependent oxidoreductase